MMHYFAEYPELLEDQLVSDYHEVLREYFDDWRDMETTLSNILDQSRSESENIPYRGIFWQYCGKHEQHKGV